MNQEQLMQALGNVDEDLIAEATSYERKVPRGGNKKHRGTRNPCSR